MAYTPKILAFAGIEALGRELVGVLVKLKG